MEKPYFVYVLYSCSADRFYIGLTENVDQRLMQHNAGRSRWTRRHTPWECVYRTQCDNLTEARRLENRLKRQKRGAGFFALTGLDASRFGPKGS